MRKEENEPLNEGTAPGKDAVVETETVQVEENKIEAPEAGTESDANSETDQSAETEKNEGEEKEEKAAVVAYAIRLDELGHTYLESGNVKSETETTVEFEEGFTADKKDVFTDHVDAYEEIELRAKA